MLSADDTEARQAMRKEPGCLSMYKGYESREDIPLPKGFDHAAQPEKTRGTQAAVLGSEPGS